MADTDFLLENYVPVVKYHGLNTAKDCTFSGTVTFTGTTNLTTVALVDLTTTGNTSIGNAATDTLSVTGVSTFTAGATTDAVNVTGTAITTGKAIDIIDLAALTSGIGINVTSAATAITGAGRLIYSSHSGATTTSGILNEFASAATDETVIVKVTASAANALGTAVQVSTATTTGTGLEITANSLTSGKAVSVTSSSASTDGATSFEPALFSTTMTGIGGVGGRVRAYMTTNVALGSWSNALKGEVTYGASGRTTGLGSAVCAEMTMSAGTTSGTYAPLEVELNLGSNAPIGTDTSLIYGSINGTATAFLAGGHLMSLQGLGAASSATNIFHTTGTVSATHGLRINIGGVDYDILLKASTYA